MEQVLYSKKPGFRDIMSLKHADDFWISDLKTSSRRAPNEAQTQPYPAQRQTDLLPFGGGQVDRTEQKNSWKCVNYEYNSVYCCNYLGKTRLLSSPKKKNLAGRLCFWFVLTLSLICIIYRHHELRTIELVINSFLAFAENVNVLWF